jgi:mannose-6-phosphate isomerase-like protein (cupin superfamily)
MVAKFEISDANAVPGFGMACQRLLDGSERDGMQPFGAMACFLAQGGSSEPDCHEEEEVIIVLSGTGVLYMAGERAQLSPKDVAVLPPNKEHTVVNSGEQTLEWLSIYWVPSGSGEAGD